MINDLEKKLNGTIPVNRNDLIKLINSWGRTYECYIHDEFNNEIYINKKSPKECYDLSNLDVSEITDLSYLFIGSLYNGDLSKWNTKSCENMSIMFYHSFFNNDSLKDWNTSNVNNLEYMFNSSKFNGDLSNWNLLKVTNTRYMFTRSMFNNNSISNWNISNILDMNNMFLESTFNGNISKWNFNKKINCDGIFYVAEAFKKKYNYGNLIPNESKEFLKWFEANRMKMASLNITEEEELDIDDYLDAFNLDNSKNNLVVFTSPCS